MMHTIGSCEVAQTGSAHHCCQAMVISLLKLFNFPLLSRSLMRFLQTYFSYQFSTLKAQAKGDLLCKVLLISPLTPRTRSWTLLSVGPKLHICLCCGMCETVNMLLACFSTRLSGQESICSSLGLNIHKQKVFNKTMLREGERNRMKEGERTSDSSHVVLPFWNPDLVP